MRANANFVAHRPTAADVHTVLRANIATDMETTSAFGAGQPLLVAVAPTVPLGCMKSKRKLGW